jgi:hypothetical protein
MMVRPLANPRVIVVIELAYSMSVQHLRLISRCTDITCGGGANI